MQQTGKSRIAGILLIVSGGLGILGTLVLTLILWAVAEGMAVGFGSPGNIPVAIIWLMGVIVSIPAIIAVLGGVNALKRRYWGLALAGAICACLYFNLLGIPGLVFVILSRNEFGSPLSGLNKNG